MINYFDVLGIEIIDDINVIKKAYSTIIRITNQNSDLKRYDEVTKAWTVLSDTELRKKHISELEIGESIEELIEEFNEFMYKEKYTLAERILTRIKDIESTSRDVRFMEGNLYVKQKKFDKALTIMKELYDEDKEDFSVMNKLMFILAAQRNNREYLKLLDIYVGKFRTLNISFVRLLNENYCEKDYEKNLSIVKNLMLDKHILDLDGLIILTWAEINNKYFVDEYSNFKFLVESIFRNLDGCRNEGLYDWILDDLENIRNNLSEQGFVKEKVMINLYYEKFIGANNSKDIKEMEEYIKILEEAEKIKNDTNLRSELVDMIIEFVNNGRENEGYFQDLLDEVTDVAERYPEPMRYSAKRIKLRYSMVYDYVGPKFFDTLIEANTSGERYNQRTDDFELIKRGAKNIINKFFSNL